MSENYDFSHFKSEVSIFFCMLNCLNIIFVKTQNDSVELLGRNAGEYLPIEFRAYDYSVADNNIDVEYYLSDEAVNVILPLDMPLVEEKDLLNAVQYMRRKKISSIGLGGRNSKGIVSFDRQRKSEYFVTGEAFLQLNDAKNRQIVYNLMRERVIERHLLRDVEIISPSNTYIDDTVLIAPAARILPFSVLKGSTAVRACAEISASYIEDSSVEESARVQYSHVVSSRVCARASVGPFARLRGAEIGADCRVGDFVEVKASKLGNGVKAAHLAYIGDAEVGKATNVGCGTVFCNYDGKQKHKTNVGENCFIGANSNLIAPLSVGDGAFIAAGTTVAKDIERDTFTIGRVRAETKKK